MDTSIQGQTIIGYYICASRISHRSMIVIQVVQADYHKDIFVIQPSQPLITVK